MLRSSGASSRGVWTSAGDNRGCAQLAGFVAMLAVLRAVGLAPNVISRVPTLEESRLKLPSGLKAVFEPSTELVRWARRSPDSPSTAQRFRRKTGRRTFACTAGRIPLHLPGHRECCAPSGDRSRPPRDRAWPQGRHSSLPEWAARELRQR